MHLERCLHLERMRTHAFRDSRDAAHTCYLNSSFKMSNGKGKRSYLDADAGIILQFSVRLFSPQDLFLGEGEISLA